MIKDLINEKKWRGGWYQNITFPNGEKSISTNNSFSDSRGLKKWDIIKPYLTKGRLLDIGCNAGLYLVKAKEMYSYLYGVDVSEHFLKQCQYTLDQFNIKAKLFCSNALSFNLSKLPYIDTTIMINALYWAVYSDERGFIEGADKKLDMFINNLSKNTKDLILVGSETIDRVGGRLDITLPLIEKYFKINESKLCPLNDRTLNLIYATTKHKINRKVRS